MTKPGVKLLLACCLVLAETVSSRGLRDSHELTAEAATAGVLANRTQLFWGGIVDGAAYGYGQVPDDMRGITSFEAHAGKNVAVVPFGSGWQNPDGTWNAFQPGQFDAIRNSGSIPLYTWQSAGPTAAAFRNAVITAGTYDNYIVAWAVAAKAWGHPFFLRFDQEMDGWWYPWGEGQTSIGGPIVNGNQVGDFVRMWRHVHDIFTEVGATNVTWIWCTNHESTSTQYPPLSQIYPGDSYVDWTGMDPYNRYTGAWLTFNQTLTGTDTTWIRNTYQELVNVAPTKPMMMVEFGSFESPRDSVSTPSYLKDLAARLAASHVGVSTPRPGLSLPGLSVDAGAAPVPASAANKPGWLRDALLEQIPNNFPAIKGAIYFNWDVAGSTIPIESSPASQAAFADSIASSLYAVNTFSQLSTGPIAPPGEHVAFLGTVADTYTASDAPWNTFGGSAPFLYMNVNPSMTRRTFLRFDLSSIAGVTVDQADLQVSAAGANGPSTGTISVRYDSNNAWQESWMSWNNTGGPYDMAPTALGTLVAPALGGTAYTIQLPVTLLQSHAGGLLSLEMEDNSPDDFVIASREANDPTQTPQLIVAYH